MEFVATLSECLLFCRGLWESSKEEPASTARASVTRASVVRSARSPTASLQPSVRAAPGPEVNPWILLELGAPGIWLAFEMEARIQRTVGSPLSYQDHWATGYFMQLDSEVNQAL